MSETCGVDVHPDIDSPCQRYGYVEIVGDRYRIPRISLGSSGMELREALEAIRNETVNQYEAFEKFFRVAMGRFYNEARIDALLESGNVGIEDIEAIVEVVSGIDDGYKKKSTVES